MTDWSVLGVRLKAATGQDGGLDAAIAEAFAAPPAAYTGSVAACRQLVATVLPEWRLHVGFDASGVLPYAAVVKDDIRVAAEAPTVPLAVLRCLAELATMPHA